LRRGAPRPVEPGLLLQREHGWPPRLYGGERAMSVLLRRSALAIALLVPGGCSFVSAAGPVSPSASGDVGDLRQRHRRLRGMYYCPPRSQACVEAEIRG